MAASGGGSTRISPRQWVPRRPVHATGLGVLAQFGTVPHPGAARLGTGTFSSSPTSKLRATRSLARGVAVSGVFHAGTPGAQFRRTTTQTVASPASRPLRQLPVFRHIQRSGRQRLAVSGSHDAAARSGRADQTTFASASDLASALASRLGRAWRTRKTHRQARDENWPDWYAAYMLAEQAGKELPT